jgi:hypothetical protein
MNDVVFFSPSREERNIYNILRAVALFKQNHQLSEFLQIFCFSQKSGKYQHREFDRVFYKKKAQKCMTAIKKMLQKL